MSAAAAALHTLARCDEPRIASEIFAGLRGGSLSLWDLIWEQQRLHESRRWSVVERIEGIELGRLSEVDRLFVANAGLAELTTKPGADRLTRLADAECRRWLPSNPALATAMQALGTWSRYWNEEEAHHETVFTRLADLLELEPPDDQTIIEFRKVFPDDDMLRTLTLLAISEINAAVTYNEYARRTAVPGLRRLLLQVGADEIQHLRYFTSFAQACVDSGEYPRKGAFAVAYLFTRAGGEIYGATRAQTEQRTTHKNWWDQVDCSRKDAPLRFGIEKKVSMICKMLEKITSIRVASAESIEETWARLVDQES